VTPVLEQIWHYSISEEIPRRSLIVALIVGTIINLINRGDAIVAGLPLDITSWWRPMWCPISSAPMALSHIGCTSLGGFAASRRRSN
jgi:hypothetical protein